MCKKLSALIDSTVTVMGDIYATDDIYGGQNSGEKKSDYKQKQQYLWMYMRYH